MHHGYENHEESNQDSSHVFSDVWFLHDDSDYKKKYFEI